MKCKWKECDNEVTGKALYCSGACRSKASRASVSPTVSQVTVSLPRYDTVEPIAHVTSLPVGLAHYYGNQDKYIPRACPELLNWGPWMNSTQLEQAELKANRVTIPGDWDYVGEAV